MTATMLTMEKATAGAPASIQGRPGSGCEHGGRWMVDVRSGRVVRRPCLACEGQDDARRPRPLII